MLLLKTTTTTTTTIATRLSGVSLPLLTITSHLSLFKKPTTKPLTYRHTPKIMSWLGNLGFGTRAAPTDASRNQSSIAQGPDVDLPAPGQQFVQFGAGCFWGVELAFQRVPGVTKTEVGYTQGFTDNPNYNDVCSGSTNHSEVVRVQYDPKACSFESLLDCFWVRHDPTTLNRQGNDVGTQYRSGIYFYTPEQETAAIESKEKHRQKLNRTIVTEILPAKKLYRAEEYHQQYLAKGGRFGFKQSTDKGCNDTIRCYAPKFETLASASKDTPEKLALLFQIPNRERACQFDLTPSEASFSSEHSPSMSSVPQSSTKFSLADLKSKMVKKEKSEVTPAPRPLHVPATRSAKRKKSADSVINLESFEGFSASETKDKLFLGIDHLLQLFRNQEDELLGARDKYLDLKTAAAQEKEASKKEVEAVKREMADMVKTVEEEKRAMAEEAQTSAASSVVEAMYEMAKEAAAEGFSLPSWDVKGWAQMLGKMEDEEPVAEDAGKKAAEGEDGGGDDGALVGEEGVMKA